MGILNDYLPPYPKTTNLVLASLMTALVCVATLLLQIPVPATTGYFNIGEAFLYITAILFGPFIGGFAGGVGAGLADVIGGWYIFAPATLVIKFCEGFFVGFIIYWLKLKYWEGWKERGLLAVIVTIGGLIMVTGYFIYESILWGIGAAIIELPINFVQLSVGLIIAVPTTIAIQKGYPILEYPSKEST